MSMSELERRCVDAAHNTRGPIDGYMLAVVRAVLAEAGVAELVEALNEYKRRECEGWCDGGLCPSADDCGAYIAAAALAKTGATQ